MQAAIESYTSLVTSHPLSPRASFGLAVCIQAQAEMLQDPAGTEKAITLLNTTCFLPDIKEKILTHAISFLFEIQRMQSKYYVHSFLLQYPGFNTVRENTLKTLLEKGENGGNQLVTSECFVGVENISAFFYQSRLVCTMWPSFCMMH